MKIAYLMAKYNPNHELVNAVKRVLDAPNPEPNYATERANNLQKTASELGIKVEELEHQINRN